LLREDNADLRLTPVGRDMGLVDERRWRHFSAKCDAIAAERSRLESHWLKPAELAAPEIVAVFGPAPTSNRVSALDLLRRPEGSYEVLRRLGLARDDVDAAAAEQVEIDVKYAGYVTRQQADIARAARYEQAPLPPDFDYAAVAGLSNEVRQKLLQHRPETLAQASRIAGVTPAAVSLLLVHLKKQGLLRLAAAG